MPHVMRNIDGEIIGLFEQPQQGRAEENLPDDAAEVLAFLAQPPTFYRITKTAPWLRMSTAEAEIIFAAMTAFDVRLRAIYDAAQYLQSNDPLWPTLRNLLATELSPARADELLAPES